MIKPIDRHSDFLEFECTKCKRILHHVIELTADSSLMGGERYNTKNWNRFKIYVQCDICGERVEYKMELRPDLEKEESK
jgi:ribosomal protein S27E